MDFSEWAQRLDRRLLGPVPPWREARPRDLIVLVAVSTAVLVVGLVLFASGVPELAGGFIGSGIGGVLAAYPAYRIRRKADRKRLARSAAEPRDIL